MIRRGTMIPGGVAGTAAAFFLVVSAPAAHAQCGEGAGVCSEPHEGPGCVDPDCCAFVCKYYAYCCEISWDQDCANLAIDNCRWVECGNPGSCTTAHGSPGCEDLDCCQWVCPFDSYCCFVLWDEPCATEATELCGVPPCFVEIPAAAVDENEHCYDHDNDGCSVPGFPMIDVTFPAIRSGKTASGGPRDTDWYRFTLSSPKRVRITLNSEFPGLLVVTRGPCLGPISVTDEAWCVPCGKAIIDRCFEPGTYACQVGAGDGQRVYRTALTCDEIDPDNPPDPMDPPPIPSPYGLLYSLVMEALPCVVGDLDGDGTVGQMDLALLLGAWGTTDSAADLDGDGVVASADLAILLGAWSAL
jgi:hypothetical protein